MASDVTEGFYVAQMGVKENSDSLDSVELHERLDTLACAQLRIATRYPEQVYRPWFVLEVKGGKRVSHKARYRLCSHCGSVIPRD